MKLGKSQVFVVACIMLISGTMRAYGCCPPNRNSLLVTAGIVGLVSIVLKFSYDKLAGPYYTLTNIDTFVATDNSVPLTRKKYDEVPSLASHNSHTFPNEESSRLQTRYLQNQVLNFKEQLELGVRTFLIDIRTAPFTGKINPAKGSSPQSTTKEKERGCRLQGLDPFALFALDPDNKNREAVR